MFLVVCLNTSTTRSFKNELTAVASGYASAR
jgi:hypothetical protein